MIQFLLELKPDKKLLTDTAMNILSDGSKKGFWNLEEGNFKN